MDTSNNTTAVVPDWEKVVLTTSLTMLSLLSAFGNGMVAVSFLTYRPLRTLTNHFIISLAVSDILVAVINMPVWIMFIMANNNFLLHGEQVCCCNVL